MSDLAKRWAVAAVGIPAVLGLLYLGGWPLAFTVAAFAALGAVECHRLAVRVGVPSLPTVASLGAAALVLTAAWRPTWEGFAPVALAVVAGVLLAATLGALATRSTEDKPLGAIAATLLGALYVGLPLAFVPLLHALPVAAAWSPAGTAWAGGLVVALPLAATWLGDAVAFFAGTAWGRGGLAPTISPNKSWVGVWGGLFGAAVAGAVWYLVAEGRLPGMPVASIGVAALVGALLGAGAIVGDLVESLLKRDADVKDSGAFFPGHGGVLDRLDALLFTLPCAYAALLALEAVS